MCKKCKYTLPNKMEIEEPLPNNSLELKREDISMQKQRYIKMLLTPYTAAITTNRVKNENNANLSNGNQHSSNDKYEKTKKNKNIETNEDSKKRKDSKTNVENDNFFSTYLQYIRDDNNLENKVALSVHEINSKTSIQNSRGHSTTKSRELDKLKGKFDATSLKIESENHNKTQIKKEGLDSLDSKEESREEKSNPNYGFKITSGFEKEIPNKDVLSSSNIIKALRMLAKPECSISLEGEVFLSEAASEITSTINDISIIACEFVPTRFIPNSYKVCKGKLYVQCEIHKTIEYTSATKQRNDGSILTKKQQKMDIPFQFCTTVTFPESRSPLLSLLDQQSFTFLNEDKYSNETNRKVIRNKIEYNEPIQFELISAMFHEATNISDSKKQSENENFRSFHSTFSVDVQIGILQLQKVKLEMGVVEND
ncbi:hypothetical protein CIB95_01390 [Lottiidibacillus patelloidae]|uniref:DUF7852 domain-containing protein n=2 Tax=Lottiidibacillus patelloidae TaxID=2670334 RepID=A0A263BWY5_9BACI|nr:hypothetical protein CIB95_01390 [Lottiidibacillus patelloidae]